MVSRHAFPAMGPTQLSPEQLRTPIAPTATQAPGTCEQSTQLPWKQVQGEGNVCACGRNAETVSWMDGLTDKEGLPTTSTHDYLGLCPPYGGRHQSPLLLLLIIP